MVVSEAYLSGLLLISPDVYTDSRGYFLETYNKKHFARLGIDTEFVQDNQSLSRKNVLRGLHFQNPPYAQGKLVRVVCGSVQDVVVDIRKSSETYGRHFSVILSGENRKTLWIPPGFAHGFLTLEKNTVFSYKCSEFYVKEAEDCLLWSDPVLSIEWQNAEPMVSEKDQKGRLFNEFSSLF